MGLALDVLLSLLQLYFLLMNVTVERYYCGGPFPAGDTRFLIPETIAFCSQHNKLFLARPDWMVAATCVSAYIFSLGYLLVLYVTWTKSWKAFSAPLLLLLGAKTYGIFFYHYMEFTSQLPPTNLIPYFSVEGPYILSMAIVLYQVTSGGGIGDTADAKRKKK